MSETTKVQVLRRNKPHKPNVLEKGANASKKPQSNPQVRKAGSKVDGNKKRVVAAKPRANLDMPLLSDNAGYIDYLHRPQISERKSPRVKVRAVEPSFLLSALQSKKGKSKLRKILSKVLPTPGRGKQWLLLGSVYRATKLKGQPTKGKTSVTIASVKNKLFYYAAFAFLVIFASYGLERLFGVPLWLNLGICLLVGEGMEAKELKDKE